MLPAGASMVHPHFQVFGGPAAPWLLALQWERAAAFRSQHGVSYWQALVDEETASGERAIAGRAGWTWLAAYAPTGGREVMAVLPGRARFAALDDEQVAELARGLSTVLSWYEHEGLSAFNFSLLGGPLRGRAARRTPWWCASSPARPSSPTTAPTTTSCRSSSAAS